MLTSRFGWILPDDETTASRSRVLITSAVMTGTFLRLYQTPAAAAAGLDRRVVRVEVTPEGRATVRRVARSAESHLADMLAPLNLSGRQRLHAGLEVLRKVFSPTPNPAPVRTRRARRGAM